MRRMVPVATVAIALVAFSDCGGNVDSRQASDGGAFETGNGEVSLDEADVDSGAWGDEEFRAVYESAVCDHVGRCCGDVGRSFDRSACGERVRSYLRDVYPPSGPHRTLDVELAKACVAARTRFFDDCGPYVQRLGERRTMFEIDGICAAVYRDDRALPGGACIDGACAAVSPGVNACQVTGDFDAGKVTSCRAWLRAKKGESCGVSATEFPECAFADGLRCDAVTATCQPLVPAGGACQLYKDECVGAAYCDDSGVCVPEVPLGAECKVAEYWSACADGGRCDSTGHCSLALPLLAHCSANIECASWHCEVTQCTQAAEVLTYCGAP